MQFKNAQTLLAAADDIGLRRVLIVTALSLELKAVMAHVEHMGSCIARDGNVYEFGKFNGTSGSWLVVVGESGAGNHQSQATVTTALNEFGGFEMMLFVGVAATRKTVDAPIGSVVAANLVYQAPAGKYVDGQFNARPRDIGVNRRVLGLMKKIAREERWHERLRPPYGGAMPTDKNYPQPFPPAAVIAPIVSVESVSADANSELERNIANHQQDATALEMEGYGAAFAADRESLPFAIIRGISDAREKKDAALDVVHQPIAAAHGAGFGFELIDLWGSNYPSVRKREELLVSLITNGLDQPQEPRDRGDFDQIINENSRGSDLQLTQVVINFTGDESSLPPDTRDKIMAAIKAVTGNLQIEYVREEHGSYHLFLNCTVGDLRKLEQADLSQHLPGSLSLNFVGVLSADEYRQTPLIQSVLNEASHALLSWPQTLPDGTWLARPEQQKLLNVVQSAEGTTTVLLGSPGSGKSALLASFCHQLKLLSIPFFAIKADLLGVNVSSEQDLQDTFGLSQLPSDLIRTIAKSTPTVLIIDQLDALAGYIDLRTGRLSSMLNLVRKLARTRGVHIVLSARTFEFEHDVRLKSVSADSLILELPAWSSILKVLENNGINANGWPGDAQEVMRSPQALVTLLKLSKKTANEPFTTYQAALEQLWIEQISDHQDGAALAELLAVLAEDMAEQETLWVPRSRYDRFSSQLMSLLSAGFLTTPDHPGMVGFSHQTIFEFVLARSFARHTGRLSSFIVERQESLFIRPKLWAALNYLRAVAQQTYVFEIRAIWSTEGLRLHLRHLLIEFMGQQSAPLEDEVELINEAIDSENKTAALQSIIGSDGWFSRLKWTSLTKAMADGNVTGVVAAILARAIVKQPKDVLRLVKEMWLPSAANDWAVWSVLQDCRDWSEASLSIANILLHRTAVSPYAFDHLILTLGAEQPDSARWLVLTRLNAMLNDAVRSAMNASDEDDDILYQDRSLSSKVTRVVESTEWDSLEALALVEPENFLRDMWPWLQTVFAILRNAERTTSDSRYAIFFPLDFRFEDEEDSLRLNEHPLLAALKSAVEAFAKADPTRFLVWLDEVQAENAQPAQRLLAHGLASQPERFASQSLAFLIADKRRFQLGNLEDYSSTTKRLVKTVNSHWTERELQIFTAEVANYSPRPDASFDAITKRYFYRSTDSIKRELIESLEPSRLSKSQREYLSVEQRRLGTDKRGATFTGPSWIGSSMSAEEMLRARDSDILNAFRELPDATGWDNPSSWQKGGNVQLSRAFADFAKKEPRRALHLLDLMEPDASSRAAGYAYEALADDSAVPDLVDSILRLENKGFAGSEYRGGVARAVEKLNDRDLQISDSVLSLLIGWLEDSNELANDDKQAEFDEAVGRRNPEQSESNQAVGSVLWGQGGLTVLPNGNFPTLETIIRVLLKRKDYQRLIEILNEHLNRKESHKVWTSLLRLFQFIRPSDTEPVRSFLVSLFARYPKTATSFEAVRFLAYAQWTVPDFVHSTLRVWRELPDPIVQQAFGEISALVSLMQPELSWAQKFTEDIVARGASPARVGVVFAAVHVWAEADKKQKAGELLTRCIRSADPNEWSATMDLFRLVDEITPDQEWIALLDVIADEIENQPATGSSFLIERLQTLLPHQSSVVARISLAIVVKWQEELSDVRTGTATAAPDLIDIALTLHRLGKSTRVVGLALFELLLTINAYTVRDTLSVLDNRFRRGEHARRPSLPRRRRRTRVRSQ